MKQFYMQRLGSDGTSTVLIRFILFALTICVVLREGVVGWCESAGSTSSAGCPTNLDNSRARNYCACSRCGWFFFFFDIFSLVYLFFFFLPFWETAWYRLKYCLKGPLNPNQSTNQPPREKVLLEGGNCTHRTDDCLKRHLRLGAKSKCWQWTGAFWQTVQRLWCTGSEIRSFGLQHQSLARPLRLSMRRQWQIGCLLKSFALSFHLSWWQLEKQTSNIYPITSWGSVRQGSE